MRPKECSLLEPIITVPDRSPQNGGHADWPRRSRPLSVAQRLKIALVPTAALWLTVAVPSASALTLDFAAPATVVTDQTQPLASYRLPTGPFVDAALPEKQVEGRFMRRVWRLDAPGQTTLEILTPLRAQIKKAGYDVIFQCATQGCGGFDFRYTTDIQPEPDMHVDLGDFRFLSAISPTSGVLSLMVSRSSTTGYVQLIEVVPPGKTGSSKDTEPAGGQQDQSADTRATERQRVPGITQPGAGALTPVPSSTDAVPDPGEALLATGSVTLEGLDFASGSSELTEGAYPSLSALATWLKANPDRTVMLVGHTDTSGSLEGNTALSRRRAQSVRQRMIANWGIPGNRIDAEGAGPLAPRASNLTEAGRTLNRRVEAVLASVE